MCDVRCSMRDAIGVCCRCMLAVIELPRSHQPFHGAAEWTPFPVGACFKCLEGLVVTLVSLGVGQHGIMIRYPMYIHIHPIHFHRERPCGVIILLFYNDTRATRTWATRTWATIVATAIDVPPPVTRPESDGGAAAAASNETHTAPSATHGSSVCSGLMHSSSCSRTPVVGSVKTLRSH